MCAYSVMHGFEGHDLGRDVDMHTHTHVSGTNVVLWMALKNITLGEFARLKRVSVCMVMCACMYSCVYVCVCVSNMSRMALKNMILGEFARLGRVSMSVCVCVYVYIFSHGWL